MTGVVHVSITKFPSSLKNTEFYNILEKKYVKKGRDVKVPIPTELYKNELIISTVYDMVPTIEALSELTGNIDDKNYDFILQNKEAIHPHIEILKKLYPDNKFLKEIIVLVEYINSSILLFEIIENDYVNLLKYCITKDLVYIDYENICPLLVKKGKYLCLKYLHSIGAILDKRSLDVAIKYKSDECVDYIIFYTDVE